MAKPSHMAHRQPSGVRKWLPGVLGLTVLVVLLVIVLQRIAGTDDHHGNDESSAIPSLFERLTSEGDRSEKKTSADEQGDGNAFAEGVSSDGKKDSSGMASNGGDLSGDSGIPGYGIAATTEDGHTETELPELDIPDAQISEDAPAASELDDSAATDNDGDQHEDTAAAPTETPEL